MTSEAHEVDAKWAARRSIPRCGDDDEEFVTTRGDYLHQKRRSFERGAAWQAEQDESAAQRAERIRELEADLDMARQEYHELEEFHRLYIYPYKQRAEQAEAILDKIQDVLSSAPECDKYSDDDTISCGWKKDMIEARRILDESGL